MQLSQRWHALLCSISSPFCSEHLSLSMCVFCLTIFAANAVRRLPLRTYLLNLLLSLLAVFPAAYTLGVPSLRSDTAALVRRLTWIRLFAELS